MTVKLQVAISAAGAVDEVAVAEPGGPAFDAAALAAVKRFVFEPAEIDGVKAPVQILYRYNFTLKVEAPTTAAFEGVVRLRKTQKPIARATLRIEGGPSVVTDDAGRFKVEGVPPGKRAIDLSGEGLPALRTEETFEAGKRVEATYEIEEPQSGPAPASDEEEIVVSAPPLRKQVLSTEVPADQARKVPGASGDVLKVVENLPGVARAAVGTGALVVWGAAPQDTRVYVDGVRVPRLYHDGGLRSVVHTDLVQSVELSPGGYGAAYGRGLGGLVTVELRPLEESGFHGSVAADVFDAAGSARASIGDRFHVAVAVRKSWLDVLLPAVTSRNTSSPLPHPPLRRRAGAPLLPHRSSLHRRARRACSRRTAPSYGSRTTCGQRARPRAARDRDDLAPLEPRLRAVSPRHRGRRRRRRHALVRHRERSSLASPTSGGIALLDLTVDALVFGLRASWRGAPLPSLSVVSLGPRRRGHVSSAVVHRARLGHLAPARGRRRRLRPGALPDQVNARTTSASSP